MGGKRKPRPAPARPAAELMEPLAVRIPAALRSEMAEDARRLGVDVSAWFRSAARAKLDAGLADELRDIREVLELAQRKGVSLDALALAIKVELR